MATGARGEGVLVLEGEQHRVLFTLRALADAERATGKTALQLMAASTSGGLGVGDVAALLAVGLAAARREHLGGAGGHNLNDAWRLLDNLGFSAVAAVVVEAMTVVMTFQPAGESADPPA